MADQSDNESGHHEDEEALPPEDLLYDEGREFMDVDESTDEEAEAEAAAAAVGGVVVVRDEHSQAGNPARVVFQRNDESPWSRNAAVAACSSSVPEEYPEGDEVDGLLCPICYQGWTEGGDHAICCLPCGHIFGMSCIKKWLQQRKKSGKCPKCNASCTLRGIRRLYATQLVTIEEESQKRIGTLEAKCAALEKKDGDWHEKQVKWEKVIDTCLSTQAELIKKLNTLEEKASTLDRLFKDVTSQPLGSTTIFSACNRQSDDGPSCGFELQTEVQLDGSRLFDINASSQIIIIARRPSGMGIRDTLTKTSLVNPHEAEDIFLPSSTRAVKDLHISPSDGKLAIFASLGKTLSVLSLESNNVVLGYKLPVGAWSCSWDLNNPYRIYAGLQNGMLMAFDMRQTQKPMESHGGLTRNPIHTTCSIMDKPSVGVSTVLTASSIGLCEWRIGSAEERPILVPESADYGVCISLAYCPSSDDIVASYRPKVEVLGGVSVSQISSPPSSFGSGVVQGYRVCLRRMGSSYWKLSSACADVSNVRLPKSVIIDSKSRKRLFASGDETTSDLVLQELHSLSMSQRIKLRKPPFRDIKFSAARDQGFLGCLSDDILQLFRSDLV